MRRLWFRDIITIVVCIILYIVHGVACLQEYGQRPFLQPAASMKDQAMRLKTIYHHAPETRMLRRRDISAMAMQSSPAIYVKANADIFHSPRDADKLRQLKDVGQLMRWSTIAATSSVVMEPTLGLVPDVKHRPTVLALAIMTNNAYTNSNQSDTADWYDLGPPWSVNSTFGWDSDGIRGHVFGNEDNSLLVISIKGTSAGLWTGGPTGDKDKFNDNMLFSCCCARISRAWKAVCDCYHNNDYQCEASCLERNLLDKELYYDHALEIYKDVSDRYPKATVWLTGHSLGGALASLVGQTFGVPTVTFESPGDQLASSRLHLPHPPGASHMPIWHFGHTGDPIFVGVCTGPLSSCWYGGFAMETRCHTGKICVWDTVNDKGWRVDIRSHRVQDVIENILKKPEEFPLPECTTESDECRDCGLWEYTDERDVK